MKNIYFVEAGFSFDSDVYLPYATGSIAAYLKKKGCFDEKFNMAGFFYRRAQTDSIVENLDEPYIVGFSCSVWNHSFNLKLAEKIKEKYPDCLIIFGGHNVSRSSELLKNHPFIDILIYGEGERVFEAVLNNDESRNFTDIGNISFRRNGNIFTTAYVPPCSIDELPSPYTEGIFDSILEKEEHTSLLCVLETNRGCPYTCSYCDWCAGKKVRLFPIERVFGDILWFAKQKIEYCFCADSNFGMFGRDIEIARFAAATKKEKGYPKVLRTCFAKESNENVFEISKIFNDASMDKGATMAYQTLSHDALSNINRKNLTLEHFGELLKKYNEAGIPTYSELILGLPGETKDSFCEGICKILESGQHNSLSIYYLEMLPNSELSEKSYMRKHGIKTIEVGFNHMHSINTQTETEEYSHIVQSTATLSKKDWVDCNIFAITVQTFHSLGFLRFIAMYLNTQKNIPYYSFYKELTEFIMNSDSTLISTLFKSFEEKLISSLSGEWNYVCPDFGEISWAFEEGAYLQLLQNCNTAYEELDEFVNRYLDSSTLSQQLKTYQKAVLRKCAENNQSYIFDYDFLSFFTEIHQGKKPNLLEETAKYTFYSEKNYTDIKTFAKEIVWFGRRKGATVYSNRPNSETAIIKSVI